MIVVFSGNRINAKKKSSDELPERTGGEQQLRLD
jgi:hypothetical protein